MANPLRRCSPLSLYEGRTASESKVGARRTLADAVESCRRNPPRVPEDGAAGQLTGAPLEAAPACRADDALAREGRLRSADSRREGSSAAPSMPTTRVAIAFPEPLRDRERPVSTLRCSPIGRGSPDSSGRPEPREASQ